MQNGCADIGEEPNIKPGWKTPHKKTLNLEEVFCIISSNVFLTVREKNRL